MFVTVCSLEVEPVAEVLRDSTSVQDAPEAVSDGERVIAALIESVVEDMSVAEPYVKVCSFDGECELLTEEVNSSDATSDMDSEFMLMVSCREQVAPAYPSLHKQKHLGDVSCDDAVPMVEHCGI